MLVLAERLKEANGGVLDDSAVMAVAEATGAPIEYVRLAVKLRTDKEKRSWFHQVRSHYFTLEPDVRRYVISGFAATFCALFQTGDSIIAQRAKAAAALAGLESNKASQYSVLGMIALVWLTLGLYNVAVSKDQKTAAIGGAIFGGGFCASMAVFSWVLQVNAQIPQAYLILYTAVGAVVGLFLQKIVNQNRQKLGLRDPIEERQALLRQLKDLQDKLREGEQSVTFLSVDIVGSTKMKTVADPLDVEFTFREYHNFVEVITNKHGGRVHSTAGDGVTCAFPHPQQAFAAARNIQSGLIELNTFRNRVGMQIVVRQGVHTGTVLAPDAGDIKSVHFAHVIDIAAHLQKLTPPGTIAISDSSAMYLPGGERSLGSEKVEAMGIQATVWSPKAVIAGASPATPPPAPKPASEAPLHSGGEGAIG